MWDQLPSRRTWISPLCKHEMVLNFSPYNANMKLLFMVLIVWQFGKILNRTRSSQAIETQSFAVPTSCSLIKRMRILSIHACAGLLAWLVRRVRSDKVDRHLLASRRPCCSCRSTSSIASVTAAASVAAVNKDFHMCSAAVVDHHA
jgi:hypothetical protein